MDGHPNTPLDRGNLYCSSIMQVGQSITANKNQLMVETAAGAPNAPKEDLEKLWEPVGKDNQVIKEWRTLATCVALPTGYQLTLTE